MANPTGTATLDKTTYAPGETMTLTLKYSDADTRPIKGNIELTNPDGSKGYAPFAGNVADPVQHKAVDPDRTWTLVSDDGATAKYTSKA